MLGSLNKISLFKIFSTLMVWTLLSALTIQISSNLILDEVLTCKFVELEESKDSDEKEKEKELEDFVLGDHELEDEHSTYDMAGMADFDLPLLEHFQNIVAPPPELG